MAQLFPEIDLIYQFGMIKQNCVQVLFYGGRIKSDSDTVVINFVGSLLYCIMHSYHKISLVCLTALLTSDTSP